MALQTYKLKQCVLLSAAVSIMRTLALYQSQQEKLPRIQTEVQLTRTCQSSAVELQPLLRSAANQKISLQSKTIEINLDNVRRYEG